MKSADQDRPDATVDNFIRIVGAREHNLRSVHLALPKNKLICFTGVSGSGKSSLAFDTIYAEGQRRYIESLSSYARQFLGQLPKPDVDEISGLAPSISIQQKTSGWNPRSTVGTITQIHDYLRVLFARAGTQHCTNCGKPISSQTREQMVARVLTLSHLPGVLILAPKIRGQKGEHRELFVELAQAGFARARVDGEIISLTTPPELDRYRRHNIEVVVDRVTPKVSAAQRISEAIELAMSIGDGNAIVAPADANAEGKLTGRRAKLAAAAATTGAPTGAPSEIWLSAGYACSPCGLSFEPPHPQMFSFNSPQGMCLTCDGLGVCNDFDPALLVPDPTKSFLDPCVVALRTKPGKWRRHIYDGVARHLGFDLDTPWRDLPRKARDALLYGTGSDHIAYQWRGGFGVWMHGGTFEGVIAELRDKYRKSTSAMVRRYYEQFMRQGLCGVCRGARLNPQALAVRLTSEQPDRSAETLNIHDSCKMSIREALKFFEHLQTDGSRAIIAAEPLKEIRARLKFLIDVGLDYLTLDRAAPTLSGGESQRIRLASQIGSGLVGVLYVLDEPSIGLHPRDNQRLLGSLLKLRDMGNTVIVVEHDRDTMEAADLIVDFGPGPGVRGGRVTAQGTLAEISAAPESLTGAYLSNRRAIETPAARRPIAPAAKNAERSAGKKSPARARSKKP
ncbi:MAG: excinuclease ABC subunit UvrA [Phycisphaerales bacterium]|nr:excinuclease ABC subunit UvrA [Phycisphaerales bacterium]